MDQTPKQMTTLHFMLRWGPPASIVKCTSVFGLDLAIMEFEPSGTRLTYRYATNGAADYAMGADDRAFRQELYCCTRLRSPWVAQLLEGLATHAKRYLTRVGTFDTIPVGEPIDGNRSPFTAVVITPPSVRDGDDFGAFLRGEEEIAIVNQVIGLHSGELDYCRTHGSEAFWQEISKTYEELLIDSTRPPMH